MHRRNVELRNIITTATVLLLQVTVNLGHVKNKVDQSARVAPLVIVPRNELHKVVVQGDTSSDINNG